MKIVLKGQIAEVVEEHGKTQIRVLVDPFYVTLKNKVNLHLGERVDVAATLQVEKMRLELQPNGAVEL